MLQLTPDGVIVSALKAPAGPFNSGDLMTTAEAGPFAAYRRQLVNSLLCAVEQSKPWLADLLRRRDWLLAMSIALRPRY